jgi:hypothetical protein
VVAPAPSVGPFVHNKGLRAGWFSPLTFITANELGVDDDRFPDALHRSPRAANAQQRPRSVSFEQGILGDRLPISNIWSSKITVAY